MDEKIKDYPSTENFKVVDIIGIPHPYCISEKHVAFTADNHNGILNKSAIIDAEKYGIYCDICKKNRGKTGRILKYEEHEQALLVECKIDVKVNKKNGKLLTEYLLSIKEKCEKDGFAGFAFKQGW